MKIKEFEKLIACLSLIEKRKLHRLIDKMNNKQLQTLFSELAKSNKQYPVTLKNYK